VESGFALCSVEISFSNRLSRFASFRPVTMPLTFVYLIIFKLGKNLPPILTNCPSFHTSVPQICRLHLSKLLPLYSETHRDDHSPGSQLWSFRSFAAMFCQYSRQPTLLPPRQNIVPAYFHALHSTDQHIASHELIIRFTPNLRKSWVFSEEQLIVRKFRNWQLAARHAQHINR